ncbi:MAG: Arc family DNA-binding protein [Oscillospiraceae bacterium]|nr:Arc family DNA-binding protein [Oscillospiraceae bacterium]
MAVSKAQQKAVAKYENKAYDKTLIRMQKGGLSLIKSAAEEQGESVNSYIIGAVNSRLKSEGRSKLPVKQMEEKEET